MKGSKDYIKLGVFRTAGTASLGAYKGKYLSILWRNSLQLVCMTDVLVLGVGYFMFSFFFGYASRL